MKIQESGQNYLETILILSERNGSVRAIDIVHELEFTKASISVAMKRLREENYVQVDCDGNITLTDRGKSIAEEMYERHRILTKALTAVGVDETIAAEDACKIEHHISRESFEKIKKYIEKK